MHVNTLSVILAIAFAGASVVSAASTPATNDQLVAAIDSKNAAEIEKVFKNADKTSTVLVDKADVLNKEMLAAIVKVKPELVNVVNADKTGLVHLLAQKGSDGLEEINAIKEKADFTIVDNKKWGVLHHAFEHAAKDKLTKDFFAAILSKKCEDIAAQANADGFYPIFVLLQKFPSDAEAIFKLWSEVCPKMKVDFKVKGEKLEGMMNGIKAASYKDDMKDKEMTISEVATAVEQTTFAEAVAAHEKSASSCRMRMWLIIAAVVVGVLLIAGVCFFVFRKGDKQEL